jgi:hypothetical protein
LLLVFFVVTYLNLLAIEPLPLTPKPFAQLFYEGTPPSLGDADYSLKGMPDSFDLMENTSKRKEW